MFLLLGVSFQIQICSNFLFLPRVPLPANAKHAENGNHENSLATTVGRNPGTCPAIDQAAIAAPESVQVDGPGVRVRDGRQRKLSVDDGHEPIAVDGHDGHPRRKHRSDSPNWTTEDFRLSADLAEPTAAEARLEEFGRGGVQADGGKVRRLCGGRRGQVQVAGRRHLLRGQKQRRQQQRRADQSN